MAKSTSVSCTAGQMWVGRTKVATEVTHPKLQCHLDYPGPKTAMKYIKNEDDLKKKCEDEKIRENLERNRKLIDMEYIPENYKKEIINKFELLDL